MLKGNLTLTLPSMLEIRNRDLFLRQCLEKATQLIENLRTKWLQPATQKLGNHKESAQPVTNETALLETLRIAQKDV